MSNARNNTSYHNNIHYLNKDRKAYAFLLYLISPLLSLVVAIDNYRASWAKNIVWLFIAFYGYTMVISNEGIDANFYKDEFIEISQSNLSFSSFADSLYNEEDFYVDILQPIISYFVSLFTSDYHILFLFFAVVFGYFYSRNIWFIIDKIRPLQKGTIPFIITFAFIIGFWQINGFRMWTAAHIFFFGAINYLINDKKNGLLIAISSVFVHFSFALPIVVLLLHSLKKDLVHLSFIFFILTFFIGEINLVSIRETLLGLVPDLFNTRVSSYTNEDYAEVIRQKIENKNWYAAYYGLVLKWVVFAFLSIIYFKGLKYIRNSQKLVSLLSFTFLFLGVANLASFIPSGGRFISIANLFALTVISFSINLIPIRVIHRLTFVAIPLLLFYCIMSLRIGLDTIGVMTIFGNPIIAMLINIDTALIEMIK